MPYSSDAPASFGQTTLYQKLLQVMSRRPALVALYGDSQTANNSVDGGYMSRSYYSNGFASEWRSQSKGKITMPVDYNRGVGGTTTHGIITKLFADFANLPVKPDIVVLNAGSNAGPENTWIDIAAAIKFLTEQGVIPFLIAPIPKVGQTPAERSSHIAQTRWLRGMQSGRKDLLTAAGLSLDNPFLVADASRYITDYTSTISDPLSGMLLDGLHYGPQAAFLIGREMNAEFSKLFGANFPQLRDLRDTFIAGTGGAPQVAPNGSLASPNLAIMQGTGGTVSSDVYPNATLTNNGLNTGLDYRRWSGNSMSTITLSKVAKLDPGMNGTRQRVDIAVSAAAASNPQGTDDYRFTFQVPTTGMVAGDFMCCEMELDIISSNRLRSVELSFGGGTDGKQCGANLTAIPHSKLLRTPVIQIQNPPTGIQGEIHVFVEGVAGAQASVCFDGLVAYKCGALG